MRIAELGQIEGQDQQAIHGDRAWRLYRLRQRQADENREKARLLLERLRYRGYATRGTLGSPIQVLGNWGRRYWAVVLFGLLLMRLGLGFLR